MFFFLFLSLYNATRAVAFVQICALLLYKSVHFFCTFCVPFLYDSKRLLSECVGRDPNFLLSLWFLSLSLPCAPSPPGPACLALQLLHLPQRRLVRRCCAHFVPLACFSVSGVVDRATLRQLRLLSREQTARSLTAAHRHHRTRLIKPHL